MGPRSACEMFISSHPEAKTVKAELYGSLAATGKGHLTDHAIREVFSAHGINAEIKWFPDEFKTFHPNALTLIETEPETAEETYYSVGGGKVIKEGDAEEKSAEPYDNEKLGSMSRLLKYSDSNGYQFWEVAIEAEGNDILDYMLPSSDCKAWLKKADSAVIPTSGSAADCKWVLVAYLWTIRESGTRVILQGDVWKKARKYFIKNILEHKYSEFFDGHTDYATLVAKYDYFKDDLNELKEPESNPTELAEEIKTKLTSSAAAINKTIKESSDKIRENITNNISNLTDEIHQTTSTRTERSKNIEVALEKIAEILKKIWNGQKISEEESEHIDAVLRELLARLEARLGSEVMIRMTDKQKETEGLPIGDPVYIIQKGQIALVMSELFKDLSFPKPLLDKYLRDIKEGTEHELEPINPKTIKKYRDLARRPKASK